MSGKIVVDCEGNDLDSPSNKRMKEMSIDRLSALPDGILIHILSFLGVQRSAVTSVLSKRWRFLWAELPRLEFTELSDNSVKVDEFVRMVNRTLLIRAGIHLEKLEFCFWYDGCRFVGSWLDFAFENKVKEVGLMFLVEEHIADQEDEDLYVLPERMFSNSHLTRFSVRGCILETQKKIEWQSLTRLDICHSILPQCVVENILSGCPVLHTLNLEECRGFNCLDVKSQNLCILKVHDRADGANGDLLEIEAPHVHTLNILFDAHQRKLVLGNIKSIVRAEINFTSWPHDVEYTSITKELFQITLHVKELELGFKFFQVLSKLVVNGWKLPVSRRKSLIVNSFLDDKHNISGIIALLNSSPNLERFVINSFEHKGVRKVSDFSPNLVRFVINSFEYKRLRNVLNSSPNLERFVINSFEHKGRTWSWDKAAPADLDCDLLHLKAVRIIDFADSTFGGEPMLTVARTLLKRAMVLEEMTVRLGIKKTDKICQTLLNYPRSSEKAVIRLHE